MTPADLQTQLARYAESDDQTAFAEVVRAAAPLVWRVAMRRLADPQLAEEAAQNVFLVLARKAAVLATRPGLLAWLHRAATLEASSLARARRRRHHRLHTMAQDTHSPDPSLTHSQTVGPDLDEALNRLSTDERTLLIGRFYEDRPLRDLAGELGKSEEAAKKQAQRALAKLERLLRRRGAGVTGTALVALLGSEFSAAAVPAQVTSSLVSSTLGALGAGPTAPSLLTALATIMTSTKFTSIAAGVLVVLLASAARQEQVHAALRRELAGHHASGHPDPNAQPAATPAKSSVPAHSSSPPTLPLPDPLDAASLLRAIARSSTEANALYDPGPGMDAAQNILQSMSLEKRWALWDELQTAIGSPVALRLAREWVLLYLAEDNPRRAMELAIAGRFSGHTQAGMLLWAKQDPAAAWEWLSKAEEEGRLLRTRAGGEAPEDVLKRGFAEGLTSLDLDRAVDFTRQHLGDEGAEWLVGGTGVTLVRQGQYAQLLELVDGLPTDAARTRALVDAARATYDPFDVTWGSRNVLPLLDRPEFPPALRQDVLREVAATAFGESVWPSLILMHQGSPPEHRDADLVWLIQRFAKERASQLSGTITLGNPDEQRVLDTALDAASSAMTRHGDPRMARELAEKVRDPQLRAQSLTRASQ
jgi:RNA polymerase sigma factor (sigma-70 family)